MLLNYFVFCFSDKLLNIRLDTHPSNGPLSRLPGWASTNMLCYHVCVAGEGRRVIAPSCPRSTACPERSPVRRVESFRSWSSHLFHGQPGGRRQVRSGGQLNDMFMWSWRAMFAGVTSSSRATCPNTEMHRQDRRWDSEVRPVRCSTSSFRSQYQKGKTNLDFTEARNSEWQWHQLRHMQVCTLPQTDNHVSTTPFSFYRPDTLPVAQPTASKHWMLCCYNKTAYFSQLVTCVWSCVAKRWRWLGEEMYGAWSGGFKTKGKTKEDLERGCTWGLSST